jgi:hypothetical protein
MKTCFCFVLIGASLFSKGLAAQNPIIPSNSLVVIDLPDHSRMANVKDTNYTRILDGIYISKEYVVTEAFKEVAYVGNLEDVKLLKVNSSKPLMIISTKSFPIETSFDSMLLAQNQAPDFPSYVKLPIVFNGKLMNYSDRQKKLPYLKASQITQVKYVNPDLAKKTCGDNPFGLLEIVANTPKK